MNLVTIVTFDGFTRYWMPLSPYIQVNELFQQYLKKKNIHFYTANNEPKASVVERVNRTLKSKLYRYFTAVNSLRYIDVLQDLVDSYNNTYHRSIGRAPATVSLLNVGQVRRKLYGEITSTAPKSLNLVSVIMLG